MGFTRWNLLKKQFERSTRTEPTDSETRRRQSEPPSVINAALRGAQGEKNIQLAIDQFVTRSFDRHGNLMDGATGPPAAAQQPAAEPGQPHTTATAADVSIRSMRSRSSFGHIPKIFIGKKKQKNKSEPLRNEQLSEFENKHCAQSSVRAVDGDRSSCLSPPRNFFKVNHSPFVSPAQPAGLPPGCPPIKPRRSASSLGGGVNISRTGCGPTRRFHLRSGVPDAQQQQHQKPKTSSNEDEDDDDDRPLNGASVQLSDDGSSSGICSGGEPTDGAPRPPPRPSLYSNYRYEQQVNKYGDVVDYATVRDDRQKSNGVAAVAAAQPEICERYINGNMKYLNESQLSYVLSSKLPMATAVGAGGDTNTQPQQRVRVTDLDDSTAEQSVTIRSLVQRSCVSANGSNVCPELDLLESWSTGLTQRNRMPGDFLDKHKSAVAACRARDIKAVRNARFGSRFKSQLPFSCGIYKQTAVTLRKCHPRRPETVRLVEEAIERDYDLLRSEIKHPSIAMLMAACYTKTMVNHMILVLEPCDFTLNYFIHQMNGSISVPDAITLVHQIASATQYLHEFGVIHSNISSHCVLICKRHDVRLNAKLSSFELATAVHAEPIRQAINKRYSQTLSVISDASDEATAAAAAAPAAPSAAESSRGGGTYAFVKPRRKWLHDKYREKSKQPIPIDDSTDAATDHSYLTIPSEYLAYHTNYRRHLSLFNYQAPELMQRHDGPDFVYPTIGADVYGLTLMLWELLNEAVPYVVYSAATLAAQFARGERNLLPQLQQHRSRSFGELLTAGLTHEPSQRRLSMMQLLQRLREASDQYDRLESVLDSSAEETLSGAVAEEVVADVHGDPMPMPPPQAEQRRSQSSTSPEPIGMKPTAQQEQCFTTLAQSRSQHPSTWSALNKSTSSSLFDVQLHADPCGGRTSTIKRRKAISRTAHANGQSSTAALASHLCDEAIGTQTDSALGSTADELDEARVFDTNVNVADDAPKDDDVFHRSLCTKLQLTVDKSRFLNELLDDESNAHGDHIEDRASKSLGNIVEGSASTSERQALNRSAQPCTLERFMTPTHNSSSESSYRFEIDSVTLPKTPIARENTIRRYSWLTEQQLKIADDNEEAITTVNVEERRKLFDRTATLPSSAGNQSDACPTGGDSVVIEHYISPAKASPTTTRNVSIKIIHSRVTPSPTAPAPAVGQSTAASMNNSQAYSWRFGANRASTKSGEKSLPTEPADDHVEFVGVRRPTRLSYTESQLRQERPQTAAADAEQLPALPTVPPPSLLASEYSSRNLSDEFNALAAAATATTASRTGIDNVTQDFQKIIRDMEALSRNNTLSGAGANKETAAAVVRSTEPNAAKRKTPDCIADTASTETSSADQDVQQRTPIKETIMQFENWLALNKTQSPFNNTTTACDRSRSMRFAAQAQRDSPVMTSADVVVSTSTPANTSVAGAQPQPQPQHRRRHRTNGPATSESSGTDSAETYSDDIATPMRSATVARLIAASPASDSNSTGPAGYVTPVVERARNHQKTTVIKRTVVTESIVSSVADGGASSSMASPLPSAPMSSSCSQTNRRKQHTTQVRLNMTTRRQSVDGGLMTQNLVKRWALQRSQEHAVRHSICGDVGSNNGASGNDRGVDTPDLESSLLATLKRLRAIPTADELISGLVEKLCAGCSEVVEGHEQLRMVLSCISGNSDFFRNSISGSRATIRSVEDYYIDDDFVRGSNQALAANIDLLTDTSDLFDMSERGQKNAENLNEGPEQQPAEKAPEL